MKTTIKLLLLVLVIIAQSSFALNKRPLPADQAFQFSARVDENGMVVASWRIAPGYYLYRDAFAFTSAKPKQVSLDTVEVPPGKMKKDKLLGDRQVFTDAVSIYVPIKKATKKTLHLYASYQGCSSGGFCYPPTTKSVTLKLAANSTATQAAKEPLRYQPTTLLPQSEQDKVTALLKNGNKLLTILGFFGFGLLLSFTPCVLPMIPILSGIIIGHGSKMTTWKAFRLSLLYVLSMSLTYAIAGVLAGMAGGTVQAAMQTPWVISVFAAIFVLMAMALFGLYELHLPQSVQTKLSNLSNKQKGGTYWGVMLMGCLSILIVSPCITPPLVGVLGYIGQTGNATLGGVALFTMGLGMGVPLMVIGTSGGKLLPKTGPWMDAVKAIFGVMLLAMAIWMLARIVPAMVSMLLWAGLLITSAIYMGALSPTPTNAWLRLWKGLGLLMIVYGTVLVVGAGMGNTDPLKPLIIQRSGFAANANTLQFTTIKTMQALDTELARAKKNKQAVMIDYYADWCVSCKEMEKFTLSDPRVIKALNSVRLLKVDVTDNNSAEKGLEKRYQVIAPPTFVFLDKQQRVLNNFRVVGEMGADEFLRHITNFKRSI